MVRLYGFLCGPISLAALVIAAATGLMVPQASAANIITFGSNANSCGEVVICSNDGTIGREGEQYVYIILSNTSSFYNSSDGDGAPMAIDNDGNNIWCHF